MAGTFEKDSLDWRIQQLWQRGSEWLERIFFRDSQQDSGTDWQIPEWLLRSLFWLMVIAMITWAGWQLYKLLSPYVEAYWQLNRETLRPPRPSHAAPLTVAEWLKRSRTAHQQRDYREACRALYMAALQRLNDAHSIPQEASRTDGEYLHLVQTLRPSHAYQMLIHTHERLCFSQTAISAETFDRCWQAYQEIDPLSLESIHLQP